MLILTRKAYNMTKSDSLKLGMIILFVASVVCAVVIKHEQIRFIFTAVSLALIISRIDGVITKCGPIFK